MDERSYITSPSSIKRVKLVECKVCSKRSHQADSIVVTLPYATYGFCSWNCLRDYAINFTR